MAATVGQWEASECISSALGQNDGRPTTRLRASPLELNVGILETLQLSFKASLTRLSCLD